MNHRKNELYNKKKARLLFGLLGLAFFMSLSLVPAGMSDNYVSETRVIPAGYFLAYSFEMERDDTLNVEFRVTVGGNLDIDVYVMNYANYVGLTTGDSFHYDVRLQRSVEADFQFEALTSDTYYVVFSNGLSSLTSKIVEIEIRYQPHSSLNTVLMVLLIGGGVILIGFIVIKKQSEKAQFVADFPHHRAPVRTLPNDAYFNAEFTIPPQ
jgi:hypothetical protein